MNEEKKIQIGIIVPAVNSPETDPIAEKIGELIAGSGSVLICGGMSGVMARGEKSGRHCCRHTSGVSFTGCE